MLPTLGAVYSCVIGTEALLSSLEGTVSIGGVRAAFLRAEASEDEELAAAGLRPTRVGAQRAGDLWLYVIAMERMSTIRRDLRTALTCRIAAHICAAVMINAAQCDDVAHAAGVVPVLREQSIEGGAAYVLKLARHKRFIAPVIAARLKHVPFGQPEDEIGGNGMHNWPAAISHQL